MGHRQRQSPGCPRRPDERRRHLIPFAQSLHLTCSFTHLSLSLYISLCNSRPTSAHRATQIPSLAEKYDTSPYTRTSSCLCSSPRQTLWHHESSAGWPCVSILLFPVLRDHMGLFLPPLLTLPSCPVGTVGFVLSLGDISSRILIMQWTLRTHRSRAPTLAATASLTWVASLVVRRL